MKLVATVSMLKYWTQLGSPGCSGGMGIHNCLVYCAAVSAPETSFAQHCRIQQCIERLMINHCTGVYTGVTYVQFVLLGPLYANVALCVPVRAQRVHAT